MSEGWTNGFITKYTHTHTYMYTHTHTYTHNTHTHVHTHTRTHTSMTLREYIHTLWLCELCRKNRQYLHDSACCEKASSSWSTNRAVERDKELMTETRVAATASGVQLRYSRSYQIVSMYTNGHTLMSSSCNCCQVTLSGRTVLLC